MARYSQERKGELIREWQASGLSRSKFSQTHGIACTTFSGGAKRQPPCPCGIVLL